MKTFFRVCNGIKFKREKYKIEVLWLVLFLYGKMSIQNSFVQCTNYFYGSLQAVGISALVVIYFIVRAVKTRGRRKAKKYVLFILEQSSQKFVSHMFF